MMGCKHFSLKNVQFGLTLVELMVAMALGLAIMSGVVSVYSVSARNFTNVLSNSQQYESGRHSLDLLRIDLKHAGYYGDLMNLPAGTSLPDPCTTDLAALESSLAYPIQGYETDAGSPISCISNDDLVAGTDILIVRRGSTVPVSSQSQLQTGMVYLQSTTTSIDVQLGNQSAFEMPVLNASNGVDTIGTAADGSATSLLRRFNKDGASPINTTPRVAASVRDYFVHIYFVAPCSVPSDGGENCTGDEDDFGSPVPTLKRLELASVDGSLAFRIVPLVEGIDNLQIDYGIDTDDSGTIGSGVPNTYLSSPSADQWSNVVAVRINVLARNVLKTTGYIDKKRYYMGLDGVTSAAGDNYRRHVYSTLVHITNVSGRREVPI